MWSMALLFKNRYSLDTRLSIDNDNYLCMSVFICILYSFHKYIFSTNVRCCWTFETLTVNIFGILSSIVVIVFRVLCVWYAYERCIVCLFFCLLTLDIPKRSFRIKWIVICVLVQLNSLRQSNYHTHSNE